MIEIKIKCFNPGCDIHYRIDEPPELTEDLADVLDSATQNVIQVMNARELYYKQLQNSSDVEGLTITTSDGSSQREIEF